MNTVFDHLIAQLFAIGDLRSFVELGGPVLLMVILAGFFMWLLMIERILYLFFVLPRDVDQLGQRWHERAEHSSWQSKQIRHGFIAELRIRATRSFHLIRTLIALAPLMGLLGTVTGMLEVFDIMALSGSSNARAMATGIAKATIPTMAGMVTALVGLYISALLTGWTNRALQKVRYEVLVLEGKPHATT